MRLLRSTVAMAVSAACAGILLFLAVPAHAAPGGAGTHNLAVTPGHGPADGVVTAVYTRSGVFCYVARITFRWDGKDLETQLDHNCSATVKFHPPNGHRDPGTHQIDVTDSVMHIDVTAAYTIDGAGTTQAGGMTTPTPGATANDPPMVQPSAASSGILPPSSLVDAAAGAATASPKQGWTTWALVAGAVLVLGGVGILGTVMMRMRRDRGGFPRAY